MRAESHCHASFLKLKPLLSGSLLGADSDLSPLGPSSFCLPITGFCYDSNLAILDHSKFSFKLLTTLFP